MNILRPALCLLYLCGVWLAYGYSVQHLGWLLAAGSVGFVFIYLQLASGRPLTALLTVGVASAGLPFGLVVLSAHAAAPLSPYRWLLAFLTHHPGKLALLVAPLMLSMFCVAILQRGNAVQRHSRAINSSSA